MTSSRPIRVAVVEDDDRVRASLIEIIERGLGFRCILAYSNVEEVIGCPMLPNADVLLMDINLPGMSGITGVAELKKRLPQLQIIMLTVYEDPDSVFESLKAGASGYLLKRTKPQELLDAIRDVFTGGSPMTSRIARKVVASFRDLPPTAAPSGHPLTPREDEILQSLAQGFLYKEIAQQQGISINTVRAHLRSIYEKLQVQNRTEAVLRFLKK